jgi:hypothetical protein
MPIICMRFLMVDSVRSRPDASVTGSIPPEDESCKIPVPADADTESSFTSVASSPGWVTTHSIPRIFHCEEEDDEPAVPPSMQIADLQHVTQDDDCDCQCTVITKMIWPYFKSMGFSRTEVREG